MSAIRRSILTQTQAFSAVTAAGNTNDFICADLDQVAIDIAVTAATGATPSITFLIERKAIDGSYYQIGSFTAITAVGNASKSVAPGGSVAESCGMALRIRWAAPSGTTPSFAFTINFAGK